MRKHKTISGANLEANFDDNQVLQAVVFCLIRWEGPWY